MPYNKINKSGRLVHRTDTYASVAFHEHKMCAQQVNCYHGNCTNPKASAIDNEHSPGAESSCRQMTFFNYTIQLSPKICCFAQLGPSSFCIMHLCMSHACHTSELIQKTPAAPAHVSQNLHAININNVWHCDTPPASICNIIIMRCLHTNTFIFHRI